MRKRNAVEHPGGYSGKLIVTNFEVGTNGIVFPTWTRDIVNKHEEMLDDISKTFMTLLIFSEEIIARCIEKNLAVALHIRAIPDEEQDETIPIRLKYFIPQMGRGG